MPVPTQMKRSSSRQEPPLRAGGADSWTAPMRVFLPLGPLALLVLVAACGSDPSNPIPDGGGGPDAPQGDAGPLPDGPGALRRRLHRRDARTTTTAAPAAPRAPAPALRGGALPGVEHRARRRSSCRRTTPSTRTSASTASRRRARTPRAPPVPTAARRAGEGAPRRVADRVLDDSNFANDRNHTQACEVAADQRRQDGQLRHRRHGADMCLGSDPTARARNFALADAATVGAYWVLARKRARRSLLPADRRRSRRTTCTSHRALAVRRQRRSSRQPSARRWAASRASASQRLEDTFTGRTTIADLLIDGGQDLRRLRRRLRARKSPAPRCETVPPDCPYNPIIHPDRGRRPATTTRPTSRSVYYAQFADGPHIKDYDGAAEGPRGAALPSFAFVKARSSATSTRTSRRSATASRS